MTILAVFQQVAPVIGIRVPDAVMGSTQREHVQLAATANEMAARIAFDLNYDWSILKRVATLAGDSVSEGFDFPADYRRMLKKSRMWASSSPYATLTHYPDSDQWLGLEVQNFSHIIGGWTIIGDQIHIKPIVAAGQTVKFYYLTRNIVKSVDGPAEAFSKDEDRFVLDERLLRLGIIWQWKANNGMQYAEDLANFEDALASLIGADKGSTSITVGRGRLRGETYAFPGVITP